MKQRLSYFLHEVIFKVQQTNETIFLKRSKIKMPTKTKENTLNLSQYNLQDILEPLAKASAGTVRNQYLSVSRYVAGQPSGFRRPSNVSNVDDLKLENYSKDPNFSHYLNEPFVMNAVQSAKKQLNNLGVGNNIHGRTDWAAK